MISIGDIRSLGRDVLRGHDRARVSLGSAVKNPLGSEGDEEAEEQREESVDIDERRSLENAWRAPPESAVES